MSRRSRTAASASCAEGRTHVVFGSGNPTAEFVVIGEGPGADEDAPGLPFVGRAGQLLTKIAGVCEPLARDRRLYHGTP